MQHIHAWRACRQGHTHAAGSCVWPRCSPPRRLAVAPALTTGTAAALHPQIRSELAEKELILLQKEAQLLDKEQTLTVLKEEVRCSNMVSAALPAWWNAITHDMHRAGGCSWSWSASCGRCCPRRRRRPRSRPRWPVGCAWAAACCPDAGRRLQAAPPCGSTAGIGCDGRARHSRARHSRQ